MNLISRLEHASSARKTSLRGHRWGLLAFGAVVALGLSACSGGGDGSKPATQAAARVNKEEITVHQINHVLSQQRAVAPEQTAEASKLVLERLIDQELAVQKAEEFKLDRDPRVVMQLAAARKEVLSRAYMDKVGGGASKPSAEEVKQYYDDNPALFKERRVYSLQELAVEATPEQIPVLRAELQKAKNINEFVEYLKANDIRFAGNQAVRAAEQLPLATVNEFAKLQDGQAVLNAVPGGAQVVVLASSRSQPVDADRARPAIEQFLLNDRKRKLIEEDRASLRAAAKIQMMGQFAEGAQAPAAGSAVDAIQTTPTAVDIDKGLKGLK